jgi:hypothetical protein
MYLTCKNNFGNSNCQLFLLKSPHRSNANLYTERAELMMESAQILI